MPGTLFVVVELQGEYVNAIDFAFGRSAAAAQQSALGFLRRQASRLGKATYYNNHIDRAELLIIPGNKQLTQPVVEAIASEVASLVERQLELVVVPLTGVTISVKLYNDQNIAIVRIPDQLVPSARQFITNGLLWLCKKESGPRNMKVVVAYRQSPLAALVACNPARFRLILAIWSATTGTSVVFQAGEPSNDDFIDLMNAKIIR